MRLALLIVLLALGAAVAAAVLLFRPALDSAASAAPPASVRGVPAPESMPRDLVLPSEPPRAAEAPPETAEPPAEPVAEMPAESQPVDFEAKYAGRDLLELKAALSVVEERLIQLKVEYLEQKFETGDFDLTIQKPGVGIKAEPKYPDGSARLEIWKVDSNPDGTQNVKRAHMRPDEDAEVLALWQEEQWLSKRKYELQSTLPKKP